LRDCRVLVIGAGSIGSRHARNLLDRGVTVVVTDPDVERARRVDGATVVDLARRDQLGHLDGVVVASPTVHHLEHVSWAVGITPHVLVEKPLGTDPDAVDALVQLAGERIMVGYNPRLHEPVARFGEMLKSGAVGRPLAARAWFGSWLPSWRPDVDYRETYSARRDLGGGVLFDAIHELDLLCWILPGRFRVVGAVAARMSDLDIEVEDTVKALLVSESGVPVEVSLDYVSRHYRRGLDVIGTEGNLTLDWSTQRVTIETSEKVEHIPLATDVADSYVREAERFVAWIRDGRRPPVLGPDGAASVHLAAAIREAAR